MSIIFRGSLRGGDSIEYICFDMLIIDFFSFFKFFRIRKVFFVFEMFSFILIDSRGFRFFFVV